MPREGVNMADKVCDWLWHDGERFRRCTLRWPHKGLHSDAAENEDD